MTRYEILQAAIRNEYEKFDCVNVAAMEKKLKRDWPTIHFLLWEIEDALMEEGFRKGYETLKYEEIWVPK